MNKLYVKKKVQLNLRKYQKNTILNKENYAYINNRERK